MRCSACGNENPAGARFCNACGARVERDEETAPPPATIAAGRYEVKQFLGEGAKKRVYLARDVKLDRDVAIALLKAADVDDASLERIRLEARAMARLGDHPAIVSVYDIGDEDGRPYVVSQYMAGGTVADSLQRSADHRLPLDQVLRIADELCQALEHLHGRGMVHRDVKPANVWLTEEGFTKLGDFGLAAVAEHAKRGVDGTLVGTAAYISPEQALGRAVDARSDLYSLGAVVYEIATGKPPFAGADAAAMISQHLTADPPAPSLANPSLPPELDRLVLALLAKSPADRPQSAAAVREALKTIPTDVRQAPLDAPPAGLFVGREHELDQLRAAMETVKSGRGALFTVAGEPGIGKTRLAEQFASEARQRGMRVLVARCVEGEGAPAYWPWVQVVRSIVRERDAALVAAEMGGGAAEIVQVVPEIREKLSGAVVPLPPDYEGSRFRLFDAVATFLKNVAATRPLLIVIDDLHWADKSSLLLLEFLAREMAESRLLVLGTYRDVEVQRGHPLSEVLSSIRRERVYERIALRGLDDGDVRRLLAALGGQEVPDGFARAIARETEGNPFFIGETLQHLVEERVIYREGGQWRSRLRPEEMGIPESIRDVVGRRLNRLSKECNEVLAVASVIGREFDLAMLRTVSAEAAERLQALLDEAVAARVVEGRSRAAARFAFTHALIRETLYEELQTGRRLQLHRAIGEGLETLHAHNLEPRLSELSYHFFEAAQGGGDVDKATSYARRAGDRAGRQLAHEEAVAHYDRALQLLDLQQAAEPAPRCELFLRLGEACWQVGQYGRSKEAFTRAAELARELDSPQLLAESALGFGGKYVVFEATTIHHDQIAALRRALEHLPPGDSGLRARLLARLSVEVRYVPDSGERALAEEAIEMARRVGDRRALALALMSAGAFRGPEDFDRRLAMASEALAIADDIGEPGVCLDARYWLSAVLVERGDLSTVGEHTRAMARLTELTREPYGVWRSMSFEILEAFAAGRLEDTESIANHSVEAGRRSEHLAAMQGYAAQIMDVRLQQGRLQEILPAVAAIVEQSPHMIGARYSAARLNAISGEIAAARRIYAPLAESGFRYASDTTWLSSQLSVAEAAWVLDDRPNAAVLYDTILPYADRFGVAFGTLQFLGSVGRFLGLLATTLRRWDDAVRHFEHALQAHRDRGIFLWLAWTQYAYADMLCRRRDPGDLGKALLLLDETIERAQAGGWKLLLEKALALKMRLEGTASIDVKTSIDAVTASVEAKQPDLQSHAAPDGTVTILFSDMEGFSAMTDRLGDHQAHEVLRAHNAIVRAELRAHRGYEVEFMGDGFLLAFSSASRALDFAVAVQRALAAYSAEHADQPIRVRMGLHTGEPIKEGNRFFGKTVILASRIASQAAGSEILVSSLVKDLAGGGDKYVFDDGQATELKGLAGVHEYFELLWDGREPKQRAAALSRTGKSGNSFILEGDFWTVVYDGKGVKLRDVKGMHAIAVLLRHPRKDFHVVDLVTLGEAEAPPNAGVGDAGDILDPKARSEYRKRLQSLGEDLEEAKRQNDRGRIDALEGEIEFIGDELSAAFGLGGRPKKGADATERIRKAVTNRIRDSLKRIEQQHPELGVHFSNTIRTGLFCAYAPEKPTEWNL